MLEIIVYPLAAIGALTVVCAVIVGVFLLLFGSRSEAP